MPNSGKDGETAITALQACGISSEMDGDISGGETGPFAVLKIHGKDAGFAWLCLRRIVNETGFWPVLLGDKEDIEAYRQKSRSPNRIAPKDVLAEAEEIDPPTWFAKKAREYVSYEELPDTHWQHTFTTPSLLADMLILPELPNTLPYSPYIAGDHRQNIRSAIYMVLVPTVHPEEIPAFLNYGGWNDCPGPEVHVALFRRWQRLYGAEIVAAAPDFIEAWARLPPEDDAVALQLAREQYLYCSDIVDQGTETVEQLAESLKSGSQWFFWWD